MLRQNGYLWRFAEVNVGNDLVCGGRANLRSARRRLVLPTGIGVQETEAPGKICCGRPKSGNLVVMAN